MAQRLGSNKRKQRAQTGPLTLAPRLLLVVLVVLVLFAALTTTKVPQGWASPCCQTISRPGAGYMADQLGSVGPSAG